MTSLTKTTPNQILARRSKKLGEIRVPVPARTGFGHVFPLCEFSVSGEVGGGGGIFLKGSRNIFNCLLFALKGLHVFFFRSHFGLPAVCFQKKHAPGILDTNIGNILVF